MLKNEYLVSVTLTPGSTDHDDPGIVGEYDVLVSSIAPIEQGVVAGMILDEWHDSYCVENLEPFEFRITTATGAEIHECEDYERHNWPDGSSVEVG